MGCGGGKLGLEASMQEAKANPLTGLPLLKGAMEQRADPGQEESAKKNVPQVFELLPKAIAGVKVKDKKAILAAGAVVERCVKLVNDPAVGLEPPSIDPENLKECIKQLSTLLKELLRQGSETYRTAFMDDEGCSTGAAAIAGAMKALFKLEDYAPVCRQELAKSGLRTAVSCVKNDSGLTPTSKSTLLTMFDVLLEDPKGAQDLIATQCLYVLVPYCVEPKTYGVSKEFQLQCTGILETCVKNGEGITNLDGVQDAIAKARGRS
jgi:hypothetical protein